MTSLTPIQIAIRIVAITLLMICGVTFLMMCHNPLLEERLGVVCTATGVFGIMLVFFVVFAECFAGWKCKCKEEGTFLNKLRRFMNE